MTFEFNSSPLATRHTFSSPLLVRMIEISQVVVCSLVMSNSKQDFLVLVTLEMYFWPKEFFILIEKCILDIVSLHIDEF